MLSSSYLFLPLYLVKEEEEEEKPKSFLYSAFFFSGDGEDKVLSFLTGVLSLDIYDESNLLLGRGREETKYFGNSIFHWSKKKTTNKQKKNC